MIGRSRQRKPLHLMCDWPAISFTLLIYRMFGQIRQVLITYKGYRQCLCYRECRDDSNICNPLILSEVTVGYPEVPVWNVSATQTCTLSRPAFFLKKKRKKKKRRLLTSGSTCHLWRRSNRTVLPMWAVLSRQARVTR